MDALLVALLLGTVGWCLAAALAGLWWSERDRRRAAERSGPYAPKATRLAPDRGSDEAIRAEIESREQAAVEQAAVRLQAVALNEGRVLEPDVARRHARELLTRAGGGSL